MTTVQRITLGPDTAPLAQGRGPHGKWRHAYHVATAPETETPTPAALVLIEDADRLAFALCSGEIAAYLAARIADYLWTRESLGDDWPVTLREWLDDGAQWTDAPDGRAGFLCGRIERNLPGGRIHLAWLGMNGVRLQDRADGDITLDVAIGDDEGWTRENGPEPPGLALHAYRGSLFGLERLMLTTPGAEPLRDDLPDMAGAELEKALGDWAEEAEHDLALFDLRITPVLTPPNRVVVNYRWVSPELCMLFWQPAPNATGYRLEEAPTPEFKEFEMVAELTDGRQTQYKLSPPTAAPRYYRVIPLNQGVPGDPSEPVRLTPVVLNAPILQPVAWANDGGYLLAWSPIDQATSYEVQVAADIDFDPYESEVIYRGELPEVYLPPSTKPSQFYRVRAINVLYAPQNPSAWSQPRRTPSRLTTPRFTLITHARIEWEPVPGAQQYGVRVTALGEDEDQGEDVFTREPRILSADQPATYRVRAYRHPEDLHTVSEWSDQVTLAPKERSEQQGLTSRAVMIAILSAAFVALLVGAALGIGGIESYQRSQATDTPTPYPEAVLEVTRDAATAAAINATQADRLGTRVAQTSEAIRDATGTAEGWTQTPTATNTPTPTNTPDLTQTVEVVFAAGLTATAELATDTPTPTHTPDLTQTFAVAFDTGLTATAELATETPTPTATPNMTLTVEAVVEDVLTATATQWTVTPEPTATRAISLETQVWLDLTATAAEWTATPEPTATPIPPTPNVRGTVSAYLASGCYVISVPDDAPPVMQVPAEAGTVLLDEVPLLAGVDDAIDLPDVPVWLRVTIDDDGDTVTGWVRVPDGVQVNEMIGGAGCP